MSRRPPKLTLHYTFNCTLSIILYFAVPEVKAAVNEHIFHIEQTVEEETPEDGGTEDETGDETPEVREPNVGDGLARPSDPAGTEITEE